VLWPPLGCSPSLDGLTPLRATPVERDGPNDTFRRYTLFKDMVGVASFIAPLYFSPVTVKRSQQSWANQTA